MPKMRFHKVAAIVVLVGFAAWMGTGHFSSVGSAAAEQPKAEVKPEQAEQKASLRIVKVVTPPRSEHARAIRISGVTEADKRAVLATRVAGIISELPVKQGDHVKIGDIVSVCPLYAKDGTTPGYTRDGGYGTMTTAPVEQLVKVPEGLSVAKAAAATDAGATSYHAVCTVGQIKPGMRVGIIGVGGLGQFAVRIAVVKGCEVYVATRKPAAQELAMSLGAKAVAANIK